MLNNTLFTNGHQLAVVVGTEGSFVTVEKFDRSGGLVGRDMMMKSDLNYFGWREVEAWSVFEDDMDMVIGTPFFDTLFEV